MFPAYGRQADGLESLVRSVARFREWRDSGGTL